MINWLMKKLLAVKTFLFLSSLSPVVVFAQDAWDPRDDDLDVPELPAAAPNDFASVIGLIVTVAQWMFGMLMALSIVFILYSAFMYIIAQGNPERIDTAKRILIYAIVGLVVAVVAGGVGAVVQNFLLDSQGNQ